jgi:hypothetical protein
VSPRLHRAGRFIVARFQDGAVVLDPSNRSVFELFDEAADAFCMLFDLEIVMPVSVRTAEQARRVVRGLRRDLLGETAFGPNEPVGIDSLDGERLFHRYPEPRAWRHDRSALDAELEGGLLRVESELILLCGSLDGRSAVARVFTAAGYDALGHDALSVETGRTLRSTAWREALEVTEVWDIELHAQPPLRVARQRSARALARLLSSAPSRPDTETLAKLSRLAEGVATYAIRAPGEGLEAARMIGAYHELSIP